MCGFFSFDLDLPIDCDDEYWEHPDPEKRWKQPPGKPSLVAAFLCYLKLNQVLAFSLRTIVSRLLNSNAQFVVTLNVLMPDVVFDKQVEDPSWFCW